MFHHYVEKCLLIHTEQWLQPAEITPDVVGVQKIPAAGAVQERRVQRGAGARVEAAATVHAGPVHDAGGRSMAVDAGGVLHELRAQLAGVRLLLVPDSLHARRPVAREHEQHPVGAMRDQHEVVRSQLLVQR